MRNFSLAFLTFVVFAIIAQFTNRKSEIPTKEVSLINTTTNPLSKASEINPKLVNDSIKNGKQTSNIGISNNKIEFKKNIKPLTFKDKFVTSSKTTSVIFPKSFYYFKDSIFNFLNNNPEKEIIITADFAKNETVEFGLKRATYLKNKLVKYGVNPLRILTKSKLISYNYDTKGYYANGITIEYQNMSSQKKELLVKEITNKNLYSFFGNPKFKKNNTLYAYALELKNYLKKHPNKTIQIIGHTDNIGNEKANEWIGMKRAKSVKNYFTNQGINPLKIITTSKGENEPIDDNSTKKGRANNRRIEIKIN